MTSQKDSHLENIRGIRAELLQLINGMDYCLDWKPDADSWSAREVIYHLIDTPCGGMHTLIHGILCGDLAEFDLMPDLNNMSPERLGHDIERVRQDVGGLLLALEEAVAAAQEEDFSGKSVLAHLKARGRDEARTAQTLLEGLFARHWREHLGQLRELRETLGV